MMRDAFLCRFPTDVSKNRRYQLGLSARGLCLRCRRPRGRDGVFCEPCLEITNNRTRRRRAAASSSQQRKVSATAGRKADQRV